MYMLHSGYQENTTVTHKITPIPERQFARVVWPASSTRTNELKQKYIKARTVCETYKNA